MRQAMGLLFFQHRRRVGSIATIGFGGIIFRPLQPWAGGIFGPISPTSSAQTPVEPQTEADLGQLLRTTGFSSSPGLIRVLGIIPGLNSVVFAVASIWMLVAMVIAVRQALDYTGTLRAVGVCAIGWIIQTVILALVFSLLGGPRPARTAPGPSLDTITAPAQAA
jgi:hypothetical protein